MSLLKWLLGRNSEYSPEPKVDRMDPDVQQEIMRKARDMNKRVQDPVSKSIERMNTCEFLLGEISNLMKEPCDNPKEELRKYSLMIRNVYALEDLFKAKIEQIHKINQLKEVKND